MFRYGVDYYPEHWPEERWPEDAQLMAEAGFNVVRLAEFAWSRLEPIEGRYDFDWLDRAISCLSERGMQAVLGTPTASPPPWLMTGHPEMFRVTPDGRRVTFGNRREYCPNNPRYHSYSREIVARMAERYAAEPAVIGWQVDNEFGDRCYCDVCRSVFQDWLKERYGSLDELNEQWGTVFWSHVYNDWREIPLPLVTGGSPNPGLALDFDRFASDSYVRYQQLQVDILRERCPDDFITHNFMGFKYDQLNYFDLAAPLDFVSWDNYPRTAWNLSSEVDPALIALQHDAMRGLKRRAFWVMEEQSGPGGWENVAVNPRPGEVRLWAYQAIAHGANAILFFRWRTVRFGTEQYWHGILDHDAHAGRRHDEVQRMGLELQRAGDLILQHSPLAQVAIIQSYDSRFAFQVQSNNPGFSYEGHVYDIYRSLYELNVAIDVVSPDTDLSAYKLVFAPTLYVLPESVADSLRRYVEQGGCLVVTARSGVKGEANEVVNQRLPGLLAEVCGAIVEEYDSLPPGVSNPLELAVGGPDAGQASASIWCDVLRPEGAEVVGRYTSDYYAGRAAITVNAFGHGHAVYVGTIGNASLYATLILWLLELACVPQGPETPRAVEVAERGQGEDRLVFVLNHSNAEQLFPVAGSYVDILNGEELDGEPLHLPPRGVVILQPTRPDARP